ncbi:uncharacterized protein BT62DRAFT_229316 [Guyanagaster necrorhizus]|uniref:Uncharacterized protein n=1 Tax=Guyanagaster necrorhizus TaxID=856835 RepID=A0A9P8AR90_9AGAR|nr:uncharacterized protein BT62DRAFT_229316 [Guyanagaster necrorhizus MCA 3950]KAG7444830.1 hypothetical protein BT62DRAFT_229316 [Guyanagaster necrorhizus MCA 3950]
MAPYILVFRHFGIRPILPTHTTTPVKPEPQPPSRQQSLTQPRHTPPLPPKAEKLTQDTDINLIAVSRLPEKRTNQTSVSGKAEKTHSRARHILTHDRRRYVFKIGTPLESSWLICTSRRHLLSHLIQRAFFIKFTVEPFQGAIDISFARSRHLQLSDTFSYVYASISPREFQQ